MDSRVVVGVGNIYANEALFAAGIHPARESGRASRARCGRLATAIKQVLDAALAEGGGPPCGTSSAKRGSRAILR